MTSIQSAFASHVSSVICPFANRRKRPS